MATKKYFFCSRPVSSVTILPESVSVRQWPRCTKETIRLSYCDIIWLMTDFKEDTPLPDAPKGEQVKRLKHSQFETYFTVSIRYK